MRPCERNWSETGTVAVASSHSPLALFTTALGLALFTPSSKHIRLRTSPNANDRPITSKQRPPAPHRCMLDGPQPCRSSRVPLSSSALQPAVALGPHELDHDTEDRLHHINHLQPAQGKAHACEYVRSRPACGTLPASPGFEAYVAHVAMAAKPSRAGNWLCSSASGKARCILAPLSYSSSALVRVRVRVRARPRHAAAATPPRPPPRLRRATTGQGP